MPSPDQHRTSDDNLFAFEDTNSPGTIPIMPTAPPLRLVPPVDTRRAEPHYTIGNNDFAETVFKLHSDTGTTFTLTMNKAATLQLIRMLEASLIEDDDAESS